jgi:hypothetical protein
MIFSAAQGFVNDGGTGPLGPVVSDQPLQISNPL